MNKYLILMKRQRCKLNAENTQLYPPKRAFVADYLPTYESMAKREISFTTKVDYSLSIATILSLQLFLEHGKAYCDAHFGNRHQKKYFYFFGRAKFRTNKFRSVGFLASRSLYNCFEYILDPLEIIRIRPGH